MRRQRRLVPKAIALLVFGLGTLSVAHADPTLDFRRFPAQPPGHLEISDPTVPRVLPSGQPTGPGFHITVDFQGNGRPDILVCYMGVVNAPIPCRTLRPHADGSLSDVTRQVFGSGALPSAEFVNPIIVGDFNKDARPDLYFANWGLDQPPFVGERAVLFTSSADGTYVDRSATLPQAVANVYSACSGDVNGDGAPDIYVLNFRSTGLEGPYLLIGRGDGTFTQSTRGIPAELLGIGKGYSMGACAIADMDRDGHADLVLGSFGDIHSESLVLFNDDTGDFTKRPRHVLPAGALTPGAWEFNGIAVLDINRDGYPDLLLAASESPNYTGIGLQILVNRGDGTFADETAARLLGPSTYHFPNSLCSPLTIADFDGDGWEDFYCNRWGGWDYRIPRIWMNDRSGRFTPAARDPAWESFSEVVDFDRDGQLDLVAYGAFGDADKLWYYTYRNHMARTVPSEPLIGKAVAGDAEIAVAFAPPLSNGASPITGYTATCTRGTLGSAVAVVGTSSPITVLGLLRGKNYACSVTATNALGTSLPSSTVNVATSPNYQGLWWNAPAGSESGWGINFAHQGDTLFATWFTYGGDGKPWWLAVTANRTAPGVFKGDLFTTTGPAFSATPWNPAAVVETTVGSATFAFTGIDHGTFDYTVDAGTAAKSVVTQSKPITRQIFDTPPRCVWGEQSNLALATNYQDMWWKSPAGSESGWGINLTQQGDTIFATWFTYDASGKPWWLAMLASRAGSKVFAGSIFTTTGPPFNAVPFDPAGVTETTVGNGTLAFTDGNNATFTYTVNGVSQAKPITRQVFAGMGTVCQ
jgi:hypothetical protein